MKSEEIVYRVAQTREELEQAFSLVYKEYHKRGYISKDDERRLRMSIYNALPATTTFVTKQADRVLASVTLIPDSPIGLPMDKLYKKELDVLRKDGVKIAEVSQLAVDAGLFGKGRFSLFDYNKLIFLFRLFKVLLGYAMDVEGLNSLCIAVNPKQKFLYRFIKFEQIGGLRYYGSVNEAPAKAFRLDLNGIGERTRSNKGLYKIFFENKTAAELFKNKFRMTALDLEYFFVKKSNIFKKAAKEQLCFIKGCYDQKGVDEIIDPCL